MFAWVYSFHIAPQESIVRTSAMHAHICLYFLPVFCNGRSYFLKEDTASWCVHVSYRASDSVFELIVSLCSVGWMCVCVYR